MSLAVLDPSTPTHLSPLNISLEQFIELDLENVEIMDNLTELALEFRLHEHANESDAQIMALYSKALENLMKVAPNLKILHPIGGHLYFPDNAVSEGL